MRCVGAPNAYKKDRRTPCLFLAGGITGCPDWQSTVIRDLDDLDVPLLNPRRAHFPIGDPGAAPAQIEWEHYGLRAADAILFWFPADTLCPIVLYELGAWTAQPRKIFVGVHPGYARRLDVEIQTKLARPSAVVHQSVVGLVTEVRKWIVERNTERDP